MSKQLETIRISIPDVLKCCSVLHFVNLIDEDGKPNVINTRVLMLKNYEPIRSDNSKSRFVKIQPLSFHEYISHKLPFIS